MCGELEELEKWKRKSTPFAIPIVCNEGKDHITDCYVFMININGINHKNEHHIQYPDVPSAIRPIPYGQDLPVLEPDSSDSEHNDVTVVARDDT